MRLHHVVVIEMTATCLFYAGPLENTLDWPEDLVLGNCHVICDIAEDRRLYKVALLTCDICPYVYRLQCFMLEMTGCQKSILSSSC